MLSVVLAASMLFACGDPIETPVTPPDTPDTPEQPKPETPQPGFESQFEKHIALWEFTGAWCANCPAGYTNMNFLLTTSSRFTDCVHPMAFHSDDSGKDELALEGKVTDKIMMDLNVASLGFPSYVVDMSLGGSLVESVNLKEHLNQTLEDNVPCCGVAVASEISQTGTASVKVKLYSELNATWRIAVYVVEDKVKYYQKDGMKEHDSYTHRHVVRRIVSESYRGDRIGNGKVAADTEVEAAYEIKLDETWNLENASVYALALDAQGIVNNMNHCMIDGGNSDYKRIN